MADTLQVNHLFASCLPQLRKAASHLASNREDSEDALQDALLLGFRKMHQFRGCSKFSTWMHTILINSVRTIRRSRLSRPVTTSIDEQPFLDDESRIPANFHSLTLSPEEECLKEEERRIIVRLIRDLPPRYREPVWLRGVEGFQIDEIADRLGLCISTTKVRVLRGFRMIEQNARNLGLSSLPARGNAD